VLSVNKQRPPVQCHRPRKAHVGFCIGFEELSRSRLSHARMEGALRRTKSIYEEIILHLVDVPAL
jgi:hypothetical protein